MILCLKCINILLHVPTRLWYNILIYLNKRNMDGRKITDVCVMEWE